MRIEELYNLYDALARGVLNITPIDHFVFDLTDDNSLKSLKTSFPGIEVALMPESGKYLVASPCVEKQDFLVLMFPQKSDGSIGLYAYDKANGAANDLMAGGCQCGDDCKMTIDNFKDFTKKGDIANRFNEFAFGCSDGQNSSSTEVKDIGSYDVSNDEPVELKNDTTDNEETQMKIEPINEEEELKDTKWVEIPNTNAHGVTVTEDGEEAEDPFADMSADATAPAADDANAGGGGEGGGEEATAPAEGDAAAAPAEGDATPAEGDAVPAEEAPAEGDATTEVDDPKAKMRELLSYYTNYMNELVQDPNTSTELISATQEMIDSLISNMESADALEAVKADQEEAAKDEVSAEEAPAEETPAEETPAEEAPAEGDANAEATPAEGEAPVAEATDEDINAKIDDEVDALHSNDWEDIQPATSDNIMTPGDISNLPVNAVDISDMAPTADEELAATAPDETAKPTSDVLDDTALPTPDEEVSLFGGDADDGAMFGPDGLPVDKFEGEVDSPDSIPCAKKINWSTDYAANGIATTDDNSVVVPEVLKELEDYYKKVADEVSKVPGKEDVAMKLQKIQILSQTISNEWNGILSQIGDTVANSYDLNNMNDVERDEYAMQPALDQVGSDIMSDQEAEEEDDLAINNQIAAFCESFTHLI